VEAQLALKDPNSKVKISLAYEGLEEASYQRPAASTLEAVPTKATQICFDRNLVKIWIVWLVKLIESRSEFFKISEIRPFRCAPKFLCWTLILIPPLTQSIPNPWSVSVCNYASVWPSGEYLSIERFLKFLCCTELTLKLPVNISPCVAWFLPFQYIASYKLPHIRPHDTHFAWNPYPLSDAPYPYKRHLYG
jgi:hypothetical protein